MKPFIILFLLLVTCTAASSQTFDKAKLEGDWYSINKTGFLRMRIHNDTIESERLSFDLKPKAGGRVPLKSHLEKAAEMNKCIYIFAKQMDTTARIRVTTIINFVEGKQMDIALNGISKTFSTLEKAEAIIKKDTREKFGYTWYSQEEIERFKKLKPISSMKKAEFVVFIKDLYEERTENVKEVENKFGTGGLNIYENQVIAQSLLKKGFNPINFQDEYDSIFKKFEDEKEVKEVLDKYKTDKTDEEPVKTN